MDAVSLKSLHAPKELREFYYNISSRIKLTADSIMGGQVMAGKSKSQNQRCGWWAERFYLWS
jgi:hypothetical protein